MSQRPHTSKVTVEDLLRLKRAERPDAEFWSKFEVELRQKQLAALVERRPWWQSLPLLLNRRVYLPVGATAVLTFTLVSLRYAPTQVANVAPVEQASEAVVASQVAEPRRDMVASIESTQPRVQSIDATQSEPRAVAEVQLSDQMPAQSELVPWSAPRSAETPSARSIAANLARLEESEPDLANALISRVAATHVDVEELGTGATELAGIAAVSSRRSRLLAAMGDRQFTPDPSAPEVVRERLSRRLGDTDYGNGWTRVGLKADRVSLKF
jgi:hypothetical protein